MASHAEIAHDFAHKIGKKKKGHNVFWDPMDNAIFSYGKHFAIAKHIRGNIVLFNTQRFSVSTSQHQQIVLSALKGNGYEIVRCYDPEADPDRNIQCAENRIVKHLEKANRARKYTALHLEDAASEAQDLKRYVELFKDKRKLTKFQKKLIDEEFTPVKAGELIGMKEEDIERQRKKERQRRKRDWKERQKKAFANVEAFKNGETVPMIPNEYTGTDFLRVMDGQVQTSQHVHVPLKDVKRAYKLLKKIDMIEGQSDKIRVGDFYIDRVDGKGVKAGCHFFQWSEVERFAKERGWSE